MNRFQNSIFSALALLVTSQAVVADVTVQVSQIGNDVVFDAPAGGSLNYNGLTDKGNGALPTGIDFGEEFVLGGDNQFLNNVKFRGENDEVTPPCGLFGADQFIQPNANTGQRFGIVVNAFRGQNMKPAIAVPDTYVSGAALSGTSTYSNRTFASMGLITGT